MYRPCLVCIVYRRKNPESVTIGHSASDPIRLNCDVPLGSVAGPILFTMYSSPLEDIISAHGTDSGIYADETQLDVMFHPDKRDAALWRIEACVQDIKLRLWTRLLKTNLPLMTAKLKLLIFILDSAKHLHSVM